MTWLALQARSTFRSFSTRNFRLFFLGQIVSVTGTWMQSVGQAWLVLTLTHGNGTALGSVLALQFVPFLIIGPWSGVIVDRIDKRKALIATQAAAAVLALILGVLTLTGAVQLWMVMALAFVFGVVNVFDIPLRQTFTMEMVGREALTNAISLNSVTFNAARVAGPAAAGLLIVLVGTGPTFIANAVSYVAVIVALLAMRSAELHRGELAPRQRGQLLEGLRYAWRTPLLRTPLLMMAVVSTFAYNFTVTLPLLARNTFHTGAGGFGLMSSMLGLGAVVGGLVTASRSRVGSRWLGLAAASFGTLMLAAALSPTYPVILALLAFTGGASVVYAALSNSTLQLNSEPQLRGRVMALYSTVFMGSVPIGGPLIGWIGQANPRLALATGGLAALLTGLAAWPALARRRSSSAAPPDGLRVVAPASEPGERPGPRVSPAG